MHPTLFKLLLNLYPPYWGTGIRVVRVTSGYRQVDVEMRLRFYNRNYFGTHFGGSLYAMVDPFYVLMLAQILGPAYAVWDKGATIEFLKPGKGTVRARFRIDDALLREIRAKTDDGDKYEPLCSVAVTDREEQVVARVEKRLYIRRKAGPTGEKGHPG